MTLRRLTDAVRRSVERHGGGVKGMLSLSRRALALVSAMGLRGLIARARAAGAQRPRLPGMHDATALPPPVPLQNITLNVGVMAHVFYPELIDEFVETLEAVPVPFTLLVSVIDTEAEALARSRFARLKQMRTLVVRIVPNRGRDIAPLLVAFNAELRELDVVAHVHTKKSLYTGSTQDAWRRYLLTSLFGDDQRVSWILGTFQAAPQLGLVYPDTYDILPAWAHTWLDNAAVAAPLAARLGVPIDRTAYFDFPAGSMFWARVPALLPLLELGLHMEDFPAEHGQTDGTVQHAVERLFALAARSAGFRLGIMPADGSRQMRAEGERNGAAALQASVADQLALSALQARFITVDVFDTLVLRPFLHPSGSRALLASRVQRLTGRADYATLRDDAEAAARQALGRDPTLAEVLDHAAERKRLTHEEAARLRTLELEMERQLLTPRTGVLAAVAGLRATHLAALSDMYLPAGDLQEVLPAAVRAVTSTWWVSCETGLRKDQPTTWPALAQQQGTAVSQWLHIGDNEHSDVQLPQCAGLINPLHILRPAALLDIVPALRPLRPADGPEASWPEQLWRGLLANQWAHVADTAPQALLETPVLDAVQTGYQVLGPVVLDMLLTTVETAQRHGVESVLLLAREGYLLDEAWKRIAREHRGASSVQTTYFLASRKATLLAALQSADDLRGIVAGSFNGTLRALLRARLGDAALVAAQPAISPQVLDRSVFLPEMAEEVVSWLQPALSSWLALAATQRALYLRYWKHAAGERQAMVVDVGYAGTIQRNLARMSGQPVGGLYFALRRGARQLEGHGWAEARYFDGRHHEGEASPILRHDLLLEALLTAPHGQLEGFEEDAAGMPRPIFGESSLHAAGKAALAQVHAGALSFIEDVCNAAGEDIASMALDPQQVLGPLQWLGEGRWKAGAWLDDLSTEDHFSGRGLVKAAPDAATGG